MEERKKKFIAVFSTIFQNQYMVYKIVTKELFQTKII